MPYDLAMLKFGGKATSIAEDELSASFSDDTNDQFIESLYVEYQMDGSPKNQKEWLRARLSKYFVFVDQKPKWIETLSLPMWPFQNGRPMVFIAQFEVPSTEVSKTQLVPSATLYVFGSRVECDGGWTTEYRVIQQRSDLP